MNQDKKTKEQYLRELKDLRERITELEKSDDERKHLSVQLRDSEARWRSLVENAADLILTIDKKGTVLFMNHTPPGLTVREVIGRSAYDFIEQEHWDMVKAAVAGVFRTGNPDHYEIWARGPHDSLAWYSTRVAPVMIDGAVTAVSVIARDITKRRQAEEEREHLILELKEALAKIKTLNGLLPICSWCKKIRNDSGYWQQIEVYIRDHSEAEFTHGICPDCLKKSYEENKT